MKNPLIFFFAFLLLATAASAAVLVYEDFDYTVGDYLDDQSAWSAMGRTTHEAVITTGNLEATGLEPPTGQQVQLYTGVSDNVGTSKRITYDADGRQTNDALYISFLLKVTDVGTLSTNNSRFLCYYRVSTYNGLAIRQHSDDSTRFDVALGRQVTDTPDEIVWHTNGGAGYSEGNTIFIVYGVDDVATTGATDLKCWINPDSSTFGGTAPAYTLATEARAAIGEDSDVFHLGCGNGATVYVDELRIGESYADVTPADSTPRGTYFLID